MNWPPEIADELPAPRDDEPSSLRQDIADELADHLHSSFTRELHFTPEDASAKQTVLDRFGDPRRVARQLWFDALKEKIVSQRLNLVLSSLMTVACLGALGLMTFVLRDSRDVNAAILEKLAALTAQHPVVPPAPVTDEGLKSMDWVRPRFKLVLGETGGPPAVGFNVQIQGNMGTAVLGESEKNGQVQYGVVEETTGADGIADLGLFRYGSYSLSVKSPWGESTFRQIGLRPGQEAVREIICPAAAPEEADVAFSIDWPEDLKPLDLWLICRFGPGIRQLGSTTWSLQHKLSLPRSGGMMGMGGGMGGQGPTSFHALIAKSDGMISLRDVTVYPASAQGLEESGRQAVFVTPSRFDAKTRFPALTVRILSVAVVKPTDGEGSNLYPIFAEYSPALASAGAGGMGGTGMGGMGGMGGGFFNVDDKGRPAGAPDTTWFSFEPVPGKLNRWTIKFPDAVHDQIRSTLKILSGPRSG